MAKAKRAFNFAASDETGKLGRSQWYKPGDDFPDDLADLLTNPGALLEGYVDVNEDTGYSTKTKDELKDELGSRGLPVSGTKEELVARLEEDDAGKQAG